jgi:tripartite-type tricarboxylate transporter receptor subunit TctC
VYVTSLLPFVIVSADQKKSMALRASGSGKGKHNLAVVGMNSSADLWQRSLEQIEFNVVPYKGAALALTDLLGGHVDYGVFSIGFVYPYIVDGKLHPVMISRSRKSPILQHIPTSVELGYNGGQGITWFSIIARDDTDLAAQEQFNSLLQKISAEKNPLSFLSNSGAEVVNWNLERSKKFIQDQKHTFESRR